MLQSQLKYIAFAISLIGSGSVFAQSSLTLYGRLNTSVEWQSQKYERQVNQSVTGDVTSQSYSQKFSGTTLKDNTSRFGLKGEEDLGNGLQAKFMIEQSVKSDVGGGTTADRRAWVGLSHEKYGQLMLGYAGTSCDLSPFCAQFEHTVRLNHDNGTTMMPYGTLYRYLDVAKPSGTYYDPNDPQTRWKASSTAPLYQTGFSTYFAFASGGNNITYLSPNFHGFSFGLRAGLSPDASNNDSIRQHSSDLGSGREQDNILYDATLSYENNDTYVGFGSQWLGGKGNPYGAGLTATTRTNKFSRVQLVASQTFFNFIQVAGIVGTGRDRWLQNTETINANTGISSSQDNFNFKNKLSYAQIGLRLPLSKEIDIRGNIALLRGRLTGADYGASTQLNDDTKYQAKVNIKRVQAALSYNFSGNTRAFGFIDWQKIGERSNNRNAISDIGLDWRGSVKQTTIGLGIRHSF